MPRHDPPLDLAPYRLQIEHAAALSGEDTARIEAELRAMLRGAA